jgi:acyl dehydratase
MYWADMVEDVNPLYDDSEYARRSRHGGMIAPPMSLLTWIRTRGAQAGVDRNAPDVDAPQRRAWPPLGEDGARDFIPPGSTNNIATRSVQEYGPPLRPGDRVFSTLESVNCSPLKRTSLGWGYYQVTLTTFYNQRDEIVGTSLTTVLRYGVPAPEGAA